MLTQNPKVRKELNHLSDSADSAIRHIKHAARDSREAAAPLPLSLRLCHTMHEETVYSKRETLWPLKKFST